MAGPGVTPIVRQVAKEMVVPGHANDIKSEPQRGVRCVG